MKTKVKICLFALGCFSALHLQLPACFGQVSTFSYQARLNENGTPFTGNAEFQVTLWDALSGENPVATNNPAQLIVPVDNGLFALPVARWNYKAAPGARHIGPVAQDFHAAFGLNGDDDKHIATVDADGVVLAAIQGLNQKLQQERAEKDQLKQRLDMLEEQVRQLRTR